MHGPTEFDDVTRFVLAGRSARPGSWPASATTAAPRLCGCGAGPVGAAHRGALRAGRRRAGYEPARPAASARPPRLLTRGRLVPDKGQTLLVVQRWPGPRRGVAVGGSRWSATARTPARWKPADERHRPTTSPVHRSPRPARARRASRRRRHLLPTEFRGGHAGGADGGDGQRAPRHCDSDRRRGRAGGGWRLRPAHRPGAGRRADRRHRPLAADPELRSQMAEAGRERVHRDHNVDELKGHPRPSRSPGTRPALPDALRRAGHSGRGLAGALVAMAGCGYIVLAHHKPRQALRLIHRLAPAPGCSSTSTAAPCQNPSLPGGRRGRARPRRPVAAQPLGLGELGDRWNRH